MSEGFQATLDAFVAKWRPAIEDALDARLPRESPYGGRLYQAMRYSVLAGGKRMRPLLVLGAAEAAGIELPREGLLRAAAAVEMVHTYSLIHDDLPAMDNDDLRRGRPTCHKQFDEATAILAGDALNTHAFGVLAGIDDAPAGRVRRVVAALAEGAGAGGMVLGQQADMELEGHPYTQQALRFVHEHKTAFLLRACALIGGVLGGADEDRLEALRCFGMALGLAFQVIDDILDIESDTATLGKTAGKDSAAGKATYPALIGLEASKQLAGQLQAEAAGALAPFGQRAAVLHALLAKVVHRKA